MMTWREAMERAESALAFAHAGGGESAKRTAEIHIAFARELREAMKGKSMAEIDRMME
jgi:hypothetical protein